MQRLSGEPHSLQNFAAGGLLAVQIAHFRDWAEGSFDGVMDATRCVSVIDSSCCSESCEGELRECAPRFSSRTTLNALRRSFPGEEREKP
jgi:hypothetical protein